jgi:hypothetical protein
MNKERDLIVRGMLNKLNPSLFVLNFTNCKLISILYFYNILYLSYMKTHRLHYVYAMFPL